MASCGQPTPRARRRAPRSAPTDLASTRNIVAQIYDGRSSTRLFLVLSQCLPIHYAIYGTSLRPLRPDITFALHEVQEEVVWLVFDTMQ